MIISWQICNSLQTCKEAQPEFFHKGKQYPPQPNQLRFYPVRWQHSAVLPVICGINGRSRRVSGRRQRETQGLLNNTCLSLLVCRAQLKVKVTSLWNGLGFDFPHLVKWKTNKQKKPPENLLLCNRPQKSRCNCCTMWTVCIMLTFADKQGIRKTLNKLNYLAILFPLNSRSDCLLLAKCNPWDATSCLQPDTMLTFEMDFSTLKHSWGIIHLAWINSQS